MKKILLFIISIVFVLSASAQTAESLQNITISNHPTKGLQRRADLALFDWSTEYKCIHQKYYVYELDLNGNRDPYSKYEVNLYASDAWVVNPNNGVLLMDRSTYDTMSVDTRPAQAMGEYTFFLIYAQSPIQLYQLLLNKAMEADTVRKRFDR